MRMHPPLTIFFFFSLASPAGRRIPSQGLLPERAAPFYPAFVGRFFFAKILGQVLDFE